MDNQNELMRKIRCGFRKVCTWKRCPWAMNNIIPYMMIFLRISLKSPFPEERWLNSYPGFIDSHALSTKKTDGRHRPNARSWLGEGFKWTFNLKYLDNTKLIVVAMLDYRLKVNWLSTYLYLSTCKYADFRFCLKNKCKLFARQYTFHLTSL